jgi:hypothetical protein
MSFVRRHAGKLVASALITAGIVYTLQRGGIEIVPSSGDFSGVRWWALAAYVPLWTLMHWFRSVRWRFLLRSVVDIPKRRLFAVSSVGYAAILLMPFRLGELVRPYLVRGGKLTMAAATSSVVADRVIDGVVMSVILAAVLLGVPTIHPLPAHVVGIPISVATVRTAGFIMLAAFVAALVVIAVFYFAREFAQRATRAVFGWISPRLAERLATFAGNLADGLHVFARPRDALGFLAETLGYWLANALGMWLLAIGCGIVHADGSSITFAETCGLMGLLGCTILIPGPPGLLGVFQAGIFAGMTMYFPTSIVTGPGAAFTFLLYMAQLVLVLLMGAWGLWAEGGARQLRAALGRDASTNAA